MVKRQLAFSVLQLVALSLPAFAILLQMVVESGIAYTHWAVPITTAGVGLFLLAGAIALGDLLLATTSAINKLALSILLLGILCSLVGGVSWDTKPQGSNAVFMRVIDTLD